MNNIQNYGITNYHLNFQSKKKGVKIAEKVIGNVTQSNKPLTAAPGAVDFYKGQGFNNQPIKGIVAFPKTKKQKPLIATSSAVDFYEKQGFDIKPSEDIMIFKKA